MNMLTSNNLEELKEDAKPAENPNLKRLMKAWESKQARTARKAGGFGMMAVSLAACGSDSDSDDGGETPEEILGNIFMLTTSADDTAAMEPTGESDTAGDVFEAPLDDASGSLLGLLGVQTLGGQDVITGTDEHDVLNAELNATGTTQNPTITDVEVLNLTVMPLPALGSPTGPAMLDLHRSEGYKALWNIDSRYSLQVNNVRTDDAGDAPVIGMQEVLGGTTYTVAYDFGETVGVQNVIANGVGGSGFSGVVNLSVTVPNGIDTLNLGVSDGVMLNLQGAAAGMPNLVVAGDGDLVLTGANKFVGLEMLDSTGYDEGLDLDVSGSTVLTEVGMGDGDDRVVVNEATVRDTLSANMGAGADTFAIDGVTDRATVEALDFTGGVVNAQTVEFVDDINVTGGVDYATLDLEGISDLEALAFANLKSDGYRGFSLEAAPADLQITADAMGPINGFGINAGDVENIGIDVDTDTFLDLQGASLLTADINSGNDAFVSVEDVIAHPITDAAPTNLETLDVTAGNNATASLGSDGGVNQLTSLQTVTVKGGNNANLYGAGIAPVAQVDVLTFSGTQTLDGSTDTMTFNIPGIGDVTVTGIPDGGNNWAAVADHIAGELDNIAGISAVDGGNASAGVENVKITRDVAGEFDPITLVSSSFGAPGLVASGTVTPGVTPAGFEALETVVVDAAENDATVLLADVYGEFTLEVTAANDAKVNLTDTNVVGDVSVTAGNSATVGVNGALHGNPNLETLTLTSDTANVTLSDDLGSFTTLDVSDVATNVVVNAVTAEYADGSVVTYLIGATDDGTAADDVTFTADDNGDVREVFQFTGDDIGNIVISNFDDGDLAEGDRDIIDFSQFANVSDDTDLQFDDSGNDIVITAASGEFEGSITLEGLGLGGTSVDVADLEQFNVNYI